MENGPVMESQIIEAPSILNPSEDVDDPSEFGDDDALLSLAEDSEIVSLKTGIATNFSSTGSSTDNRTNRTGLKSSDIRKPKDVAPIASSHHRRTFNPVMPISEFRLDGLVIGRDEEIAALKASFHRITKDCSTEVVMIRGEGGSGKSVVARSLLSETPKYETATFAEGKFDMNSTNEPYTGICKAFGQICQHVNTKLPNSRPAIQKALEAELGDEMGLLIHLISELKNLVESSNQGATKPSAEFDALEQGLGPMRYAFRVLTRIFSKECSPLVIFLDDLQWADISSLQVLDYLISDTENPNPLMIVGCYRSDEVDDNSLLHIKMEALKEKMEKHTFVITEMEIGPLGMSNVEEILTRAIPCKNDEDRRQLADLCVKRTFGNIFFVLEFLKTLQQQGFVVHYDDTIEFWNWDLAVIEEATMSTANVVVLLQDKMRKLDQQVQSFLQCAAYLGSTFTFASINAVWGTYGRRLTEGKLSIASVLLETVLERDFLEKIGPTQFRWVHDKVQEAAVGVRQMKNTFQLDIGTSLYYSLDPAQLDDDIFTVVDLINSGNVMKRPEFAEVNFKAATKAKSISAFQAAAKYASHGIELLQSSKWQENRSLTLKLYTLSAEMELILGNIAVAERRNGEVLDRDDVTAMEKLPLKLAKARTLSSVELKFGEAIDYCVDLLKELGVNLCWSRRLVPVQALKKALSTIKKVKQFPKESYKKGGIMEDPKQKAIVRLLARITYLGLNVDMSLALLCALRLIDMTMQQGVHEPVSRLLVFL